MFINISHELEVLNACFARQAAWITVEFARMSSDSTPLQEEDIEANLFHPQGPGSAEQCLCRMTVNELNALVETAMQDALVRVTGEFLFQVGSKVPSEVKLIYGLNRVELERRLELNGIGLAALDGYKAVQQVKEIAEGNKHREGLRPTPRWNGVNKTLEKIESLVPGATDTWFSSYELELEQVHEYIGLSDKFIRALHHANIQKLT
jgi:hypothetical protein